MQARETQLHELRMLTMVFDECLLQHVRNELAMHDFDMQYALHELHFQSDEPELCFLLV